MKVKVLSVEYTKNNGLSRFFNVQQCPEIDSVYTVEDSGQVRDMMATLRCVNGEWFWEPYGSISSSYYTSLDPVKISVLILNDDV